MQGQVKTFAFWPQIAMGAAPLAPAEQERVVDAALSMFVSYFAAD